MFRIGDLYLNWKVVGGLAAVGLGLWIVAPGLVRAALPLLLLAACPLALSFMMRGMQGGQCASRPTPASQPVECERTRAEQMAELKARLASVQAQQEALARQLAELEVASVPAVREAEAIARAADERIRQERERQHDAER